MSAYRKIYKAAAMAAGHGLNKALEMADAACDEDERWFAEHAPPPLSPLQVPPADDDHVAVGSSLFSDPTKLKEAPAEQVANPGA